MKPFTGPYQYRPDVGTVISTTMGAVVCSLNLPPLGERATATGILLAASWELAALTRHTHAAAAEATDGNKGAALNQLRALRPAMLALLSRLELPNPIETRRLAAKR